MNWYKLAQDDSMLANERDLKKRLSAEKIGFLYNSILQRAQDQNNINEEQAIDYIYDRLEKKMEPMTCKNCKWLQEDEQGTFCYNSNWGPNRNQHENAACGGISWEVKK